ncbi:hypothetical protein BC343_06415 [Mucilaginibacter pedocola]|uniref:Uncharacterized protein n=1 Tax=Mucilaginibacter pedocola TaxID=1792845 RepID=A0A1S9PFQ0_9SPHI|nr:hypothetical protein BC343_06415 [Mucilaginibacter pedocola]
MVGYNWRDVYHPHSLLAPAKTLWLAGWYPASLFFMGRCVGRGIALSHSLLLFKFGFIVEIG